jgi:hypothetical protein
VTGALALLLFGTIATLALAPAAASTQPERPARPASAKPAAKAQAAPPLKERAPERDGLGQFYDPEKFEACQRADPRNSRCDIYRLKRAEAPETWPFHATSPMKWPEAPRESVYRPGMSPLEYWQGLCAAEAGEFIHRTVEGVETIFQIRPRPRENEYAYGDRYAMEDPYGYVLGEHGTTNGVPFMAIWPVRTTRGKGPRYRALETPILVDEIHRTQRKYFDPSLFQPVPPEGAKYQRFFGNDGDFRSLKMEYVRDERDLRSRYGWTWRGIRRPFDRELGVAGGELAVVDLRTGETLGLRRGFVLGAAELGAPVMWLTGRTCPEYSRMPGVGERRKRNKDFDFSFWFIPKVVIPDHEYTN